jgi:glycosyltransferase involved in cell wall biosynthesis
VVNNAIDTRALEAAGRALTDNGLTVQRAKLGLSGANVCVFVGAMYREKRLPFVIAACELIRQQVPGFEMVFIGSGPDRHVVEEAVARNAWMRYVGPLFDDEKVRCLRLAKLVLMPGGVGLGILDSFALEVPVVTTSVTYHGPEFLYLEDGLNGVVVEDESSPTAYAACVAALLGNQPALERLKAGCRDAAARYTVENMAARFAAGIAAALACGA